MLRFIPAALASIVVLGGFACSSSQKQAPQSPTQTTSAEVSAPPKTETMTAGDVFAVLRNIHRAEIDKGKLAQKKATDPRVKAFADEVVKDHEARIQKDEQLMKALNISPRDNKVSDEIKNSADKRNADLGTMSGAGFDKAYIEDQVSYYRAVLDTFDDTLIPNARDPQIKSDLVDLRARANRHLREAQDLRMSLAAQAPATSTQTP